MVANATQDYVCCLFYAEERLLIRVLIASSRTAAARQHTATAAVATADRSFCLRTIALDYDKRQAANSLIIARDKNFR